jgi:hypothetical protein
MHKGIVDVHDGIARNVRRYIFWNIGGGTCMEGNNFLRTDELIESLSSLRVVELNLRAVIDDDFYWKPVLIMLHNSLQGFMICSLRGSNNYNILEKKSLAQMLLYDSGKLDVYPKEKLLDFMRLYNRIKSPKYSNIIFKSSKDIDLSINALNKWRNEFIHFKPKGLSLEVTSMPLIVKDSINLIGFIVFKSNTLYRLTQDQLNEIKKMISIIRDINDGIHRKYLS